MDLSRPVGGSDHTRERDAWEHLRVGSASINVSGQYSSIIRGRQAEGIARAKERGVYKGRVRALTNEQVGSGARMGG